MEKIVLASNNKGKIKELETMLGDRFEFVTMSEIGWTDEIEETGKTFYENALIKAKTIAQKLNVNAIADDSGLMVDALFGAPGVFSARYAGVHGDDEANKALLLENMKGVMDRRAKFHSAIVLYKADGQQFCGEGETFGEILQKPEGTMGFGYDPLFFSYDLKKSFGLASAEEKNSVSHRKRAIIDLLRHL